MIRFSFALALVFTTTLPATTQRLESVITTMCFDKADAAELPQVEAAQGRAAAETLMEKRFAEGRCLWGVMLPQDFSARVTKDSVDEVQAYPYKGVDSHTGIYRMFQGGMRPPKQRMYFPTPDGSDTNIVVRPEK